jgi:hypothetical protein
MPGSSPGMTLSVEPHPAPPDQVGGRHPPLAGEGLSDAAFKSGADFFFRQIAADENNAAVANFVGFPGALMIAVQDHVDALEHETLGIVLERQNPLAAQNARPVGGDQILHPGEKLVRIERLVDFQRDRLHVLVVVMLQAVVNVDIIVCMFVFLAMMMNVIFPMFMLVHVRFLGLEEGRLDVEDAVEVEGIAAEHLRDVDLGALGAVQAGIGVDGADARLDLAQLGGRHQVGLVDQDHVGEGDLVLDLGRVLEPLVEPLGVGDRDHGVELGLGADLLVHEEGLRHRRGVGEPGGLDDDGVELAFSSDEAVDDAHQVAAHGAADAAVVHLEHFLVGVDDELVVDADLAEFVDDDGEFLAVRLGQNAVEQRGLAGAEITGEHGDGDFGGGSGHGGGGHLRRVTP